MRRKKHINEENPFRNFKLNGTLSEADLARLGSATIEASIRVNSAHHINEKLGNPIDIVDLGDVCSDALFASLFSTSEVVSYTKDAMGREISSDEVAELCSMFLPKPDGRFKEYNEEELKYACGFAAEIGNALMDWCNSHGDPRLLAMNPIGVICGWWVALIDEARKDRA